MLESVFRKPFNITPAAMYNKIVKALGVVLIIFILLPAATQTASMCWRFTHNNHDALIIGEIIAIDDGSLVIESAGFIISAGYDPRRNLNRYLRREVARQVRPHVARVAYGHWAEFQGGFSAGDFVIASLDQGEDGFVVAWGIHRVDSLDYRVLTVETVGSDLSEFYTVFVNSRGFGGLFIAVGEGPPFFWLHYLLFGAGILVLVAVGGYFAVKLHKTNAEVQNGT
ncbi:MAG: hypothetical protein FWE42_06430 [Defluviitaleaceae bacterium]|nr:hypothetical protein [Defluviitaleaceae bacterium]